MSLKQSSNLKLISLCAYLTDTSVDWRGSDHCATKMVKALKGDAIKGYFDYKIAGKLKRFDQSNISEFVSRIPKALAKQLLRHHAEAATLVPIPNSHVVSPTTPNFKTLDLANQIAEESGGLFSVSPALVFKEVQKKARDGGARSVEHFLKYYKKTKIVTGPIILIDDVCTSGSHLIAAHKLLHSDSSPVELACTFGRTTKIQHDHPIGLRVETLCF